MSEQIKQEGEFKMQKRKPAMKKLEKEPKTYMKYICGNALFNSCVIFRTFYKDYFKSNSKGSLIWTGANLFSS